MTARVTQDLDRARADLAELGYCLVADALEPTTVAGLRRRVEELAAREIEDGTDYVYENGSNQRVWTLLNKGPEFVDLILHPLAIEMMEHLLGYGFLLSNIDANIAGPGGKPMFLHADQSFVPDPWPWPYPLVANIMWMLDDFTPDNGATRVVPGSHLEGHGPRPADMAGRAKTEPVTAPAGTALVFDGRLWHQTGANTTRDEKRHGILAYYCRPFMRQQENWFVSLRPDVLESAPPRLRQLLGYENYLSLGMIDGMPRTGARY
ncbi:MAG TPA: phytanoyl-CoA dioxygenase family protein [Acidimicrobiales bacterium]|nr:phytanoyl-CoA dioxygenase family protein [Acidimicrobiales bacterium]